MRIAQAPTQHPLSTVQPLEVHFWSGNGCFQRRLMQSRCQTKVQVKAAATSFPSTKIYSLAACRPTKPLRKSASRPVYFTAQMSSWMTLQAEELAGVPKAALQALKRLRNGLLKLRIWSRQNSKQKQRRRSQDECECENSLC